MAPACQITVVACWQIQIQIYKKHLPVGSRWWPCTLPPFQACPANNSSQPGLHHWSVSPSTNTGMKMMWIEHATNNYDHHSNIDYDSSNGEDDPSVRKSRRSTSPSRTCLPQPNLVVMEKSKPKQTWQNHNTSKPGCDGGDRLAIQNQIKPNLERITYNIVILGISLQQATANLIFSDTRLNKLQLRFERVKHNRVGELPGSEQKV